MQFWDTSAIVPLLLVQRGSDAMTATYRHDPEMIVWWATEIECVSAVARADREEVIDRNDVSVASARLDALAAAWSEIEPAQTLRRTAARLLRVHPLRAADALQLAAAIIACEGDPRGLPYVTLDNRLAQAAVREGFPVIEMQRS